MKSWEDTQQDYTDQSKHPKIADPNIDAYQVEFHFHGSIADSFHPRLVVIGEFLLRTCLHIFQFSFSLTKIAPVILSPHILFHKINLLVSRIFIGFSQCMLALL
ncbi:hypothetical protein NPIL_14181 [Nephila pilipes]|uniref:Uncharacterized protein n=1 Tax=Nephila pilipes TaxID=299642 RepID=A0A8X6NSV8_NEPPI|nr:hypothetical protein NPIL_14181 [Nephila pilipes]